jgi:periplasmic mercuric ion binding protein
VKIASLALMALFISYPAFAAEKEITATVNGMVCGFCAQGITKKFGAEASVSKVDVSLEKKVVKINLKEGQDLDDKTIEKLLQEAGYNVEKIERKK